MKILVVSNMYPSKAFPSYGVFVKNFCDQLETLGISYDLAVMEKSNSKLGKLLGYFKFYVKSFFMCLFGKFDLVYVHYASHSSPGALLARKLRKFRIYTNVHGSDVIPQDQKQEKMQKNTHAILSCSERVVVPSAFFKRVVSEKYSIPQESIQICCSGGINTSIFRPDAAEYKQTPFTIGFASRLIRGKGWDILLDACATLPKKDFQLVLVGDGPEKSQLLKKLDQLGLENNTQLFGLLPQPELADIYRQLDVFIFPTTLSESMGLVAIEAMACGTPVIASDFAAPADYVVDGVNGYKFDVGDPEALAKTITKFKDLSPEQRQILREGALETASRFTAAQVTEALKTILLE